MAEVHETEESVGWRLAAPAKLNLWLTVVGRRSDGFHELDSLLVLLDFADELSLAAQGPELRIGGPAAAGLPADRTNLAWRGWTAGLAGRPPAGGLSVDKRIPAAAGLGGGSSDAAAARRLARWVTGQGDDPPTADELVTLAAIGADVPFFASQQAVARVGGIGERVTPDAMGPVEVIITHPPFGLATGAVFAELRPSEWSGPTEDAATRPGRNDLAAPARRLRSELDSIFRLVAGAGGEPHLTGSGPTVFALTDDPERAAGVAARLERAGLATTRTRLRSEPASIER